MHSWLQSMIKLKPWRHLEFGFGNQTKVRAVDKEVGLET